MSDLTPKQEAFCREYLIDFNAVGAARRAGYSAKSARMSAERNMSKDEIQARIRELQQPYIEKLDISAELVLRELSLIAFSRPKQFMSWDNSSLTLIPSENLGDDLTAAIASVSYKENTTQFGGSVQVEVRFHDKVKALDTILQRYLDVDAAIALLDSRGFNAVPKILPATPENPTNASEAGD